MKEENNMYINKLPIHNNMLSVILPLIEGHRSTSCLGQTNTVVYLQRLSVIISEMVTSAWNEAQLQMSMEAQCTDKNCLYRIHVGFKVGWK